MTRIYLYDHCPFCVRATMVAAYKQVPFERVVLLNDDEKTCHDLIGKKMVPILEHDGEITAESLDICHKLDQIGNAARVITPQTPLSKAVTEHLATAGSAMWPLNFARITRIGLPEFATESAREYFRVNKEKMIGESFDAALARTEADKVVVEAMLASLPALSLPSHRDNLLSWDDVMIFPMLRCLTLIRDLKLPTIVSDYLEQVSQLTGVDLYFDRAI